jgi:hypothetical protein
MFQTEIRQNLKKKIRRGLAGLDGSAGSSATGQRGGSMRASRIRRPARVSERDSSCRSGPPRPYQLFLSGSTHIHPSIKHGVIFFFLLGQFHRSIAGPPPPVPASGDHLPAAAAMRSRSSTDRLEALSLEIERKLQKVPAGRFRPRLGGARCSDFVRCRFSCPGLLGLQNFPSICARRG